MKHLNNLSVCNEVRRIRLTGPVATSRALNPSPAVESDLSQRAYKAGAITLTDVLDADRQLLVARNEAESARADAARAAVGTFRALGGGWDVRSSPSLNKIK